MSLSPEGAQETPASEQELAAARPQPRRGAGNAAHPWPARSRTCSIILSLAPNIANRSLNPPGEMISTEPSVAEMLKVTKAKSSKWLNEQGRHNGRFAWQAGYGAFTVSASQLDAVLGMVQKGVRYRCLFHFVELSKSK